MLTLTQIVFRLLLAILLSAVIGFEREARHRPAGLRTVTLIGMGCCMIMLISLYFSSIDGGDPSRLVSGIVTTIGLLGTGVIIHGQGKNEVQGITTAATIFMVAGIGLAVGLGMYLASIFATILTLLVLYFFEFERFERIVKKGK